MISVVHTTNRGLYPLTAPALAAQSQYDLLSTCLRAQTFQGFELIVVDRDNPLPRPELAWLGDRAQVLRPKQTPWGTAFAPSTARNTGLHAAHGSVVLFLDDCVTFGPRLLEQVAERAAGGEYLVPVYDRAAGGTFPWSPFPTRAGGILAVPRYLACAAGGWEERFTGCHSLEDWEFSERLVRAGVRLVQSEGIRIKLESHAPRSGDYLRCQLAVYALVKGGSVANRPWTESQMAVFTAEKCPLLAGAVCTVAESVTGCVCQVRPSAATLAVMRGYECQ